MSSKKVSDLYCYRHDSESCGCREQLSFAAVPLPTSKPVVAKDVPPAWFVETLQRFVNTITMHTGRPAEHVCLEFSADLGLALGLPPGECAQISTAAGYVRCKARSK